jgi:hypothetical protein
MNLDTSLLDQQLRVVLDQASEDQLRQVANVVWETANHKSRQDAVLKRHLFKDGDTARIKNLRGVPDGVEVKILKVKRTRAVVRMPAGEIYGIPLACLVKIP